MAKVSNEVNLIIALWKEKLEKRKEVVLTTRCKEEKGEELANREMEGIEFAENRLTEIISDLEEGKL